jgi:integrase
LAKTIFPGDKLSRIYRFVVIASETAARKNAVVTLKWNQVDLTNRLVNFQNDGLARTKKRRVAVPMSDLLYAMLKQAYAERTSEWVLDNPHSIQRHFEMLTARAGEGFEKVTPHTLRHTWATQAAQAGVPLFEIAGVLGDTVQTAMKVYAHHCPDHLRGAVNFRAQAARNPSQQPPTTTDANGQVIVFKAG